MITSSPIKSWVLALLMPTMVLVTNCTPPGGPPAHPGGHLDASVPETLATVSSIAPFSFYLTGDLPGATRSLSIDETVPWGCPFIEYALAIDLFVEDEAALAKAKSLEQQCNSITSTTDDLGAQKESLEKQIAKILLYADTKSTLDSTGMWSLVDLTGKWKTDPVAIAPDVYQESVLEIEDIGYEVKGTLKVTVTSPLDAETKQALSCEGPTKQETTWLSIKGHQQRKDEERASFTFMVTDTSCSCSEHCPPLVTYGSTKATFNRSKLNLLFNGTELIRVIHTSPENPKPYQATAGAANIAGQWIITEHYPQRPKFEQSINITFNVNSGKITGTQDETYKREPSEVLLAACPGLEQHEVTLTYDIFAMYDSKTMELKVHKSDGKVKSANCSHGANEMIYNLGDSYYLSKWGLYNTYFIDKHKYTYFIKNQK